MDPRQLQLAKLLVNYSTRIKKGDIVRIQGEAVTIPLMKAIYKEVVKAGGNPFFQVTIPEAEEFMLKNGSDEQLSWVSPLQKFEVEKIDAMIVLWGSENTKYLSGVDPSRQAMKQKHRKPIVDRLFARIGKKEVRWVGTQFPTQADAQLAEMSLTDYENFVYGAVRLNDADPVKHWEKIEKEQNRLVKIMNQVDVLRIRSKDTDLTMRVGGRKWINCAGHENFPDGEVFTSPVENSANGRIRFSYPAVYGGREVTDVAFELKNGKVVKESATRNEQYLKKMLDMDKGARFVGEIAIGTNYDIKQFSRNTLFDEKIGGTCHMAVGAAFAEAGGKNKSALHWDMVCELKKGGEITGDGKTLYRDGVFVV